MYVDYRGEDAKRTDKTLNLVLPEAEYKTLSENTWEAGKGLARQIYKDRENVKMLKAFKHGYLNYSYSLAPHQ